MKLRFCGDFNRLLEAGFVDAFWFLRPDETGAYTWRSGQFENREKNRGRRIDYFLVSEEWEDKIRDSLILPHSSISDHLPITLSPEL
ncbi:MAG: endonuclease/exonuclease/phosphatase family protein [Holosporaceae bacterium]|nr:endonuclease/exonuclease/phosphatase family protein [Holosporaceae bacterium]